MQSLCETSFNVNTTVGTFIGKSFKKKIFMMCGSGTVISVKYQAQNEMVDISLLYKSCNTDLQNSSKHLRDKI